MRRRLSPALVLALALATGAWGALADGSGRGGLGGGEPGLSRAHAGARHSPHGHGRRHGFRHIDGDSDGGGDSEGEYDDSLQTSRENYEWGGQSVERALFGWVPDIPFLNHAYGTSDFRPCERRDVDGYVYRDCAP